MITVLAFDDESNAIRGQIDLVGDRMADVLALGWPITLFDAELHDLRSRSVHRLTSTTIDPKRSMQRPLQTPPMVTSRRASACSGQASTDLGMLTILLRSLTTGPLSRMLDNR